MGLKLLNESLMQVRRECNPGLALLGYLLMMYDDKSPLHRAYAQTIRDSYPGLVLETSVPVSRDLKMAVTTGQPMTLYKPRSKAAKVIQALCDELLTRDGAARLREVA
jgi:chromosome partitioning protein